MDADSWVTGSSPLSIFYFRIPVQRQKWQCEKCLIWASQHWEVVVLLLHFSSWGQDTEPLDLPLNLSGSWFPNSRLTDWEYPKQNWSQQETAEEPRGPQQSVPVEYFSPDTILFHKYMALICYEVGGWSSLCKKTDKKIKPQRKCTTQSQLLEINYLLIPEIMILAGVLSLISLR